MSQNDSILSHLQNGGTLTPLEAFQLCGTLALHSRISELRERGYGIQMELVRLPSGKHVGQYSLWFREQRAA